MASKESIDKAMRFGSHFLQSPWTGEGGSFQKRAMGEQSQRVLEPTLQVCPQLPFTLSTFPVLCVLGVDIGPMYCCCDKILDPGLLEGRFTWADSSKVQSIVVEKSWEWALEAAGHMASEAKKQPGM